MTTTKVTHTPLPWRIDGRFWVVGPGEGDFPMVADVSDGRDTVPDEEPDMAIVAANAHLIAAAPELLEALGDALTWIEREQRLGARPRFLGFDAAQNLLQRARGEASS